MRRIMKKKIAKRMVALLLTVIICFYGIPVYAEDIIASGTYGNLLWTLDSEGTLSITGEGEMDCETIPEWEDYKDSIKHVIIGDQITTIQDVVFQGYENLTSVIIPDSVTQIGWGTFENCPSLEKIVIPGSVTSIGDEAFRYCENLASVILSDGLENIGADAFCFCRSLTSVAIPDSVTKIGEQAFCDVANIEYSGTAEGAPWGAKSQNGYVDGYLVYRDSTKTELLGCGAQAVEIEVPEGVTYIGYDAFAFCRKLVNVTLPDSLTEIDSYAFDCCESLTSIIIPKDVRSVPPHAFDCCESLTSITLPKNIQSIGTGAFEHCNSLKNVYYNGTEADKKHITIYDDNECLMQATWVYSSHSHIEGKATKENIKAASISADGSYDLVTRCEDCGEEIRRVKKKIAKINSVKLSKNTFTYTGKAITPTVTVKDSDGKKLKKDTDYTVKSPSERKNVGNYTFKINFKGNYKGSKSLTMTINPKETSISKLSNSKKAFTVKWTKISKQATGYQIQYSTSKKFTSAKSKTITSNKTTSKKITSLKSKKKYYVRIRTYKKTDGKNFYSGWSNMKSVTTK